MSECMSAQVTKTTVGSLIHNVGSTNLTYDWDDRATYTYS